MHERHNTDRGLRGVSSFVLVVCLFVGLNSLGLSVLFIGFTFRLASGATDL